MEFVSQNLRFTLPLFFHNHLENLWTMFSTFTSTIYIVLRNRTSSLWFSCIFPHPQYKCTTYQVPGGALNVLLTSTDFFSKIAIQEQQQQQTKLLWARWLLLIGWRLPVNQISTTHKRSPSGGTGGAQFSRGSPTRTVSGSVFHDQILQKCSFC